jgi:hypothetical protein
MKISIVGPLTLAIALSGLNPQPARAAPMGFKDSWMSMGDFGPNWQEAFVNYAFTTRDAVGVGGLYMRSDDKNRQRDLVEANYTRLLKRWNQEDAQANLWFVGGVGNMRIRDQGMGVRDKPSLTPGVSFDYETRRVYFSATERLYRASGVNNDYTAARAGFSFYETEYDETQPWFIVEARRMHDLSDKVEVTPMLRLVNKSFFVEAGVNNSRQARFNFMYIF